MKINEVREHEGHKIKRLPDGMSGVLAMFSRGYSPCPPNTPSDEVVDELRYRDYHKACSLGRDAHWYQVSVLESETFVEPDAFIGLDQRNHEFHVFCNGPCGELHCTFIPLPSDPPATPTVEWEVDAQINWMVENPGLYNEDFQDE